MIKMLHWMLELAKGKNRYRMLLSSTVDFLAILFSAGLFGVAAYLISISALNPSFGLLMVPVAAVRFFGLGRAGLRYLERILSHDTTFGFLRDLRVLVYKKM
ncbi:MAG: thiol reductant ABC exporter subunit CydC, partial [Clostridiales bacterium]|nr:thiol reductant ABC exporter subunit CydC [Clostridiales bacterium]